MPGLGEKEGEEREGQAHKGYKSRTPSFSGLFLSPSSGPGPAPRSSPPGPTVWLDGEARGGQGWECKDHFPGQ